MMPAVYIIGYFIGLDQCADHGAYVVQIRVTNWSAMSTNNLLLY